MQNGDTPGYFDGLLLLFYLLFSGGVFQLSAASCLFSLTFPSLHAPTGEPVSASASLVIALLHFPSIKLKCEQNVSGNSNEIKSQLLEFSKHLTCSLSLVTFLRVVFH